MGLRTLPMLLTLATLLASGQPAAADTDTPVGGPLLGRKGVIVHRDEGLPKLPLVHASSYVVANADTGSVLAAKDPHGRYRPASTLKVLTAITLIPRLDPDEKVTPRWDDIDVDGSKVGLTANMRYRVEDLFLGMLLASGNDAALALARAAGGRRHTLDLMNAKADTLHADDTAAKTPNGLDSHGQRSSAYDLALFGRAGLRLHAFREYVSTRRASFPAPHGKSFRIANHNDLLAEFDGCIGIKTGYTSKAAATYIGAAKHDGHTILVTLMHAKPGAWEKDASRLLRWGFRAAGNTSGVGKLVQPGPLPDTIASADAAQPAPIRTPGTKDKARGDTGRDTPTGSWVPTGWVEDHVGPATLVALGAVTVAGAAVVLPLRRRRHVYRGRRRLKDSP